MNKRIDELFGKALDSAVPETWTTLNPAQLTKLKNKFAELIVNKCANIVWDEAEKTSNSDVNDAGYKIIEYFHGVDE